MEQEKLMQEISEKKRELNNLEERYDANVETEKVKVLKAKSTGLTKSLYLLGFDFESCSGRSPQYLEFHRVFKRELKEVLKPYTQEISIHKPNHFDISGFFKLNNGEIYYFSVSDLRWNKDMMLIRTAKDFKDYTGGSNDYLKLGEEFIKKLLTYLKVE